MYQKFVNLLTNLSKCIKNSSISSQIGPNSSKIRQFLHKLAQIHQKFVNLLTNWSPFINNRLQYLEHALQIEPARVLVPVAVLPDLFEAAVLEDHAVVAPENERGSMHGRRGLVVSSPPAIEES
jgi:hypothetical protein